MKKKDFVTLILGTIGGILFALGMCMALLPAWGVFRQGVAVGAAGTLVLAAMLVVRRKMDGKPAILWNARTVGITLLGVVGALGLGLGHVHDDALGSAGARHSGGACGHCAAALPVPGGERSGVNQSTRALLAVLPGCFCL